MKNVLMLTVMSLMFLGCGKDGTNGTNPVVNSLNSVWSSSYATLDLTKLTVNTEQSADDVLACNGNFGNNGPINGVQNGNVKAEGNETNGLIQFGNLKYVGASDSHCSDFSKETYYYFVSTEGLTLCMKNYVVCFSFTKQ